MIDLLLAMTFGELLGTLYFGGLWWTVKKAVASVSPASWFIFSLLLRLVFTLCGFYLVAGDDWRKLLACLLGFITARAIVIRLTRLKPLSPDYLPHAGGGAAQS